MCPFVVFDRIATLAFDNGSKFLNVLFGDNFPLDSCTFEWQWRNGNGIFSNFWSVHCPFSVCHSPRHSNCVVDGVLVPSALTFQPSDFTSSEHAICSFNETPSTVVAAPQTCIEGSFCSTVLKIMVSPTPSRRMAQTPVLASRHVIFGFPLSAPRP